MFNEMGSSRNESCTLVGILRVKVFLLTLIVDDAGANALVCAAKHVHVIAMMVFGIVIV